MGSWFCTAGGFFLRCAPCLATHTCMHRANESMQAAQMMVFLIQSLMENTLQTHNKWCVAGGDSGVGLGGEHRHSGWPHQHCGGPGRQHLGVPQKHTGQLACAYLLCIDRYLVHHEYLVVNSKHQESTT